MKEHNQEIEAYTKLLMQCVKDKDFFDEGLVNYLLNYKKEIIEGSYFIQREYFGVIKSNLWGYVKFNAQESDKEKWANLLNKDINEKADYEYLKFNFSDRDKRDRKVDYKPFYFKENGTTDQYIKVSEDFLRITQEKHYFNTKPIIVDNLTETEIKLIINDALNDTNINPYGRLPQSEGYDKLIQVLKNFLINNYEEMDKIAKEDKKSFLRVISMGGLEINNAFQSIEGNQREEFFQKYNLEEKVLTYVRYKNVWKGYLIDLMNDYKDKEFWIKELKCYSKEDNKFSISKAIKDIIKINERFEEVYETKVQPKIFTDWDKYKYYTDVEEGFKGKYERVLAILDFFKDELKNAVNYQEEMEKLMIVAIGQKSNELYKIVKDYMKHENGYQEDMNFNNPLYKVVSDLRQEYILQKRKEEVSELNNKLEEKMIEKGNKTKAIKI